MNDIIIQFAQALGRKAAFDDDAIEQGMVQCELPPTAGIPAISKTRAASPTSSGSSMISLDPKIGTWWPIFQTRPPLAAVYMGGRVWQIVSPKDDPALLPESLLNHWTGSAEA